MSTATSATLPWQSTGAMTSAAKSIGSLPLRALHAMRRRWAQNRLRRLQTPSAVLFVCRGNLCRSPYAAAVFGRMLRGAAIEVESAGFLSTTRPAPPLAGRAASKRGIDLSAHRSSSLTRAQVTRASMIVVMEPEQARLLRLCFGEIRAPIVVLGDLDPVPSAERRIQDPMDHPESVFDQSFERIDRCISELVRVLRTPEAPSVG